MCNALNSKGGGAKQLIGVYGRSCARLAQKREDLETLDAQPINEEQGEASVPSHWWTIQQVRQTPTQPWVAVGSSTTDCAPKVGRSEDDGILLKIKIQIQGKVYVALVDSGASRNYASPEAVVDWELPGTPDTSSFGTG